MLAEAEAIVAAIKMSNDEKKELARLKQENQDLLRQLKESVSQNTAMAARLAHYE